MSYGGVENTLEELGYLKGAKIEGVRIEDDGFGDTKLVLDIRTKDAIQDQNGKVSDRVAVEVWMDEEGNGPGYLALCDVDESKRSAKLSREIAARGRS